MAGKLGEVGEQGVTETLNPNVRRPVIEISGANWVSDPPMVQAPPPFNPWLWGFLAVAALKLLA